MKTLIVTFFLVTCSLLCGQDPELINSVNKILDNKGEVYLQFTISNKEALNTLTKIVSIDKVINSDVYAYCNRKQFEDFVQLNYNFSILSSPGELYTNISMYDHTQKTEYNFNSYPTYESYIALMNEFALNFPDKCMITEIGESVDNRKILFAKISDNVNQNENEPQFMYTSTMHGDETGGYVLMLRLIDYLLTNYDTDSRIKNLVDNLEIHINPLANPDGTYTNDNNTVSGARRYNGNSVDLNRNFPNPVGGQHPDGRDWQPETQAFIDFAEQNQFMLSANFHGGAEVINYPWDTYSERHPKDSWFQTISHTYADLVHEHSPSGYMNPYWSDNGIINGYDWYQVFGSRQDYMVNYHNCMEVTIELSNTKLVAENELENLWNYNYRSLIGYIEEIFSLTECVENLIITENIDGDNLDFTASSSIIATNTISNGAHVHYGANNSIKLQTGFKAAKGVNFYANLDGCVAVEQKSSDEPQFNIVEDISMHEEQISKNLNEEKLESQISIYPNPAYSILTLEFTVTSNEPVNIRMMNMLGAVEVEIVTNEIMPVGEHKLSFDLEDISNGMYLIQFVNGATVTNESLVIRNH